MEREANSVLMTDHKATTVPRSTCGGHAVFQGYRPSLGWGDEQGLYDRPNLSEHLAGAVILQVLRSVPLAVREENPRIVHGMQQLQMAAARKGDDPVAPPLEKLLETRHMLRGEGH